MREEKGDLPLNTVYDSGTKQVTHCSERQKKFTWMIIFLSG